jgi:hypothetical protein
MNKTEPFSCKWHGCGLRWYRKTRQTRMRTRSKQRFSYSFRHPLPQQASSKSLPFPAILFVPRLSWLIERGDGIPPRMSGIVLTVPYRNNHLPGVTFQHQGQRRTHIISKSVLETWVLDPDGHDVEVVNKT